MHKIDLPIQLQIHSHIDADLELEKQSRMRCLSVFDISCYFLVLCWLNPLVHGCDVSCSQSLVEEDQLIHLQACVVHVLVSGSSSQNNSTISR